MPPRFQTHITPFPSCCDCRKRLTSNTADTVDDIVDHLFANSIVTTSIVVGSILLAANQQLGVEELAVGSSADLVDGGGVEIAEDGPRHVFAAAGRGKEGFEGAALTNVRQVGIRLAIRAQAVLEEVAVVPNQLEALAQLF